MKKKYLLFIVALSFVIVITIISAYFIYKGISGKPENNVYYRSILVRKVYSDYYIDGDIYNDSKFYYDDAYIDLVITGVNGQDYDYEIYVGEINNKTKTYRINVNGEDFLESGFNVKIKEVYIKNGFEGNKIRIYNEIKKSQRSFTVFFPVYFMVMITMLEIIGLLFIFGLYSKYKAEVHSVSISQRQNYLSAKDSSDEFVCSYCGYTTKKFYDSCPKCGASLTRK